MLVTGRPGRTSRLSRADCRRLVTSAPPPAAGVAMVPIPGLDWITDVGVLVKLIPEINAAFGLTPAQIERLAPDRRLVVYKAISAGGRCWSASW